MLRTRATGWSSNDSIAFFERTGSHDELFR